VVFTVSGLTDARSVENPHIAARILPSGIPRTPGCRLRTDWVINTHAAELT